MHKPTEVTLGVGDIERFDEVVLCESGTPRWGVIASFFGRIVNDSSELVKLIVCKFR